MKNICPSFLNDESQANNENLVDFWLSWTFRCANIPETEKGYKKVRNYSRKILSYCMTKKTDPKFLNSKKIYSIKCCKYFPIDNGQIDLLVELNVDNVNYVLVFENKVNALIGKGQLKKYKLSIDKKYKNKNFQIIYIFLRAQDSFLPNDEQLCAKSNFTPILYWELQNLFNKSGFTGNDLFDEFWFKW